MESLVFLGFLVVWMVKRKMLAVDERLAEQLAKVARDRGQTLYSLVNEILEQALKVYEMGLSSLKQLVNERCVVEAARGAGFVLTVKPLWVDALERAFNAGEQRSLLERWRETGGWSGKYFLVKAEHPVVGRWEDFGGPRDGSGCGSEATLRVEGMAPATVYGTLPAHPVLLDGRLYLRCHDTLWCYEVKAR